MSEPEQHPNSDNPKTVVTIYTDGAAEPNPGPGGYGIVLMAGKHRKELSGGFRRTTNNRMELMGVIVALESLSRPCLVNLFSDSKYVVDSVQKGYVKRWKQKNWLRSPGDPVKNVDLWKRYLEAAERHLIRFHWVKGHAGNKENERCDELAVAAAQESDLPKDVGYIDAIRGLELDGFDLEGITQENLPVASEPIPKKSSHKKVAPKKDPAAPEPTEGEACRKCSGALKKKSTKAKQPKPGQIYCYDWYLFCPQCGTMYMVNAAKRMLT